MAFIPQPYGSTTPEAISSYDFQDITAATGYTTFYGTCASAAVTTSYALVANTVYSYPIATENATGVVASLTKTFDQDFNVLIQRPMIIRGKAIVAIPMSVQKIGVGTAQAQAQVYLYRFDGTTNYLLAQGSGSLITNGTAATTVERMNPINLDVTSSHLQRGDILKLNVQGWYSCSANTASFAIAHSPLNQTYFTNIPTRLTLDIPQRIDI